MEVRVTDDSRKEKVIEIEPQATVGELMKKIAEKVSPSDPHQPQV